ncbi:unnamed protein product [Thelazia callipaeda]|uniref:N-acylethanolamine-hydrolyzing acid amidase n=1 Tax=Thelazia callipaeda TaxID=103827 RepID=A0A0N5D066_THECL|nr:unnamed protein product [Thelazia callipaeda]
MMLRKYCLFMFIVNLSFTDHVPPRYMIDLDLAPELRWLKVVNDYKEFLPAIIKEINMFVPKFFRRIGWWLSRNILLRNFPDEYIQEMQGLAKYSGLDIGEVVAINVFYDFSAFNRGHIVGDVGCTSIVAEDHQGQIIHGRNLDYNIAPLLRNLTIIADFARKKNILYSGVTFVLNVGLLTGQRHDSFSVSLNERFSGSYIDTVLMAILTHFQNPVTFVIRMVLEKQDTFEKAKEILMKKHFMAPSYLIIAGIKPGQACIITRNRLNTADLKCIDTQSNQWFLVETNFDHWKAGKGRRRWIAEKALLKIGKYAISNKRMLQILSLHPVENK